MVTFKLKNTSNFYNIISSFPQNEGLVMFTNIDKVDPKKNFTVLHSPITLFPSEYPLKEFNYAFGIQNHFNQLIYAVSRDHEFLFSSLKE